MKIWKKSKLCVGISPLHIIKLLIELFKLLKNKGVELFIN